jgi:hypothetical protein
MKTVYFHINGKINGCTTADTPEDEPYAEMGAAPGETIAWVDGPPIGGNTQDTHYFVGDVLTERPEMPCAADRLTAAWCNPGGEITADKLVTISGIPTGATVSVRGGSDTVMDGTYEFGSEMVGYHEIVVELFPYKPKRFQVLVG